MNISFLKYHRIKTLSNKLKYAKLVINDIQKMEYNKKNNERNKQRYALLSIETKKKQSKERYLARKEKIKNNPELELLNNIEKYLKKYKKQKLEYMVLENKIPTSLIENIAILEEEKNNLLLNMSSNDLQNNEIINKLLLQRYGNDFTESIKENILYLGNE